MGGWEKRKPLSISVKTKLCQPQSTELLGPKISTMKLLLWEDRELDHINFFFPVVFFFLPSPWLLSGLEKKLSAFQASAATLPPFPNVSPASPVPTEDRKLVPSNWYKGTLCFYATDTKRRGKGNEKKPHRWLKRERNGILYSGLWAVLSLALPYFLLGS